MSGVEVVGPDSYARVIRRPDGVPGIVRFTFDSPARSNVVHMTGTRLLDSRVLREVADQVFGLSSDLRLAEDGLAKDPTLAPIIARQRGVRVPGTPDPFELAVRAVLGQQISVSRAAQLASKLSRTWGEAVPEPASGLTHAFPGPEALVNADLSRLGLPSLRRRAVSALARRVLDGDLVLDGTRSLSHTTEALLAVPGIGPWTCAYVALRALGDLDSIPTQDLGLRAAVSDDGIPVTATQLSCRAEAWRPWRGVAAVHLWTTLLPEFRRVG